MRKKVKKAVSGLLAGAVCLSAVYSGHAVYAEGNEFITSPTSDQTGVIITGITDAAVHDGTVTIPDELNGTPVKSLGDKNVNHSFLNGKDVETLTLGKNVTGMTLYALYDTPGLKKIELAEGSPFTTNGDGVALLAGGGSTLIKLCPEAVDDYTVPNSVKSIWNMDHMNLDSLDLGNTTELRKLALAGTEVGTLTVRDPKSSSGAGTEILYGTTVHAFNADNSTVYETDGRALWTKDDKELVKVAAGTDFDETYFEQFSDVSPYAFNSVPEYLKIAGSLPESVTKNKVFSFYSQNDAVFVVNGEVGFCYNHDKAVPDSVGGVTDYSKDVDATKYDQIRALMYAGVPVDGTGLFEKTFGVSYEDAVSSQEVMEHGDAALNTVSALVYHIIDKTEPETIRGTGYGPFDADKVAQYRSQLLKAVEHYKDYNFEPDFSVDGNTVTFHRNGNGYESDPFTVHTVNASGEVADQYVYTINVTSDKISCKDGGNTFRTGEEVVLVADEKPEQITFSYNEPSLKYYKKTNNNVQDVLASAVREKDAALQVDVVVEDLLISKQDAATNKELPGASLKLTKDGKTVDEWVSTNTPHKINNPEDGTYELTEITAPDGYEVAEKIIFTVKNGTVEGGKITMYDQPLSKGIKISKQDVTTGKELPGATLTITKDGEVVETWQSSDTPREFTLPDGEYTLTEVTAPDGYEVAEKITFAIKDGKLADGSDKVVMYDQPTGGSVKISKVSATTGEELPGATLVLKDAKGDVVDEWVSGDTVHVITGIADGMYTLTEKRAPKGYEVAESIEFEVKNGEAVGGTVVMEDRESEATPSEPEKPDKPEKPATPSEPEKPSTPDTPTTPDTPSKPSGGHSHSSGGGGGHSPRSVTTDWYIDVSKQDITSKTELPGAQLTITKNGTVVESWVSTTEPHKIKNLTDGEYILTEITAPDGYEVAESIPFTIVNKVLKDGSKTVVMYDAPKPAPAPVPTDTPLPKTGGTAAAAVFTAASILCMILFYKRKRMAL